MDQPDSLNLETAVAVLRARAWIVVLCVLVCGGGALAWSELQPKRYTATAALLFKNSSLAQQASGVPIVNQTDPQGQRQTDLTLVRIGSTAANTAARLGNGLTADDVKSAITVQPEGESDVVAVSATRRDPALAARMANTFANVFVGAQAASDRARVQDAIDVVQGQLNQLPRSERNGVQGQALQDRIESLRVYRAMQTNTQLVQAATVPTKPSYPRVTRNTAFGILAGLLLGTALAVLVHRLDRRMREPSDAEAAFDLPVLGVIPRDQRSRTVERGSAGDMDLEPYRMLRARMQYFNVDRRINTLLVTSSVQAEGKTTIAQGLALAAATAGTKTLLIEADLRRPMLAKTLAVNPVPGLVDALVAVSSDPGDFVQTLDVATPGGGGEVRELHALVAGPMPPNPSELLESQAMKRVLEWAASEYELVVVDTPPLLVVSDAIPLIGQVDGVIVVSRLGKTTRDESRRLSAQLAGLTAPVLGVVANDLRRPTNAYYQYSYAASPQEQATAGSRS